jgi:ATP-dependent DNA ligase
MKPQKALHLFQETDKKKPKYIGHDYMVFEKHDGWYGYIDLPSTVVCSRALREIPALKEFSAMLKDHMPKTRGRLLFEIMIEGLEYDSFPELNGRLNRKHEQVEDVYIQVHDFIPTFNVGVNAETRYKFAEEIVFRTNLPSVRLSPVLGISSSPDKWYDYAEKVWQKGGEGVILKRLKAPYSPDKRNFDLMKIKEEVTLDLKVINLVEGQGK